MSATDDTARPLLVTSGTVSWEREGAAAEHATLAGFLNEVAASETIRSAISLSIKAMNLRPGAMVLDLGCGTGTAFSELAGAVGEHGSIVGLDHGDGFLRDAANRAIEGGYADRVHLIRADAHQLPLADGSIDGARTERVLMHLADPDLALRELRRVVRPGGWIVGVEPDLTGMRLDAPDATASAQIVAGFCASIRHPAMGLEINRRMATAGLTDRHVRLLTEVERTYDDDTAEFFSRAAVTAADLGWIDRERATKTLNALRHAAADGTFLSYSSMFIVAGRVPRDGEIASIDG